MGILYLDTFDGILLLFFSHSYAAMENFPFIDDKHDDLPILIFQFAT
jgi:hypothetical protein